MDEEPDPRSLRLEEAAAMGAAPYANLFSAYTQDGLTRIAFLEENPERSRISYRSGVALSNGNVLQLIEVLKAVLADAAAIAKKQNG